MGDAELAADVLIVGGGPGGALLGYLLARRGFQVVLAERQATLEREFRGETIAAASVVTLRKLGFGPALEAHGYLRTERVTVFAEGRPVLEIDYRRFAAGEVPIDLPQPALIGMFVDAAARYPGFSYLPGMTFVDLVEEDGVVRGGWVRSKNGRPTLIRSRLLIGADGRFSKVRRMAGLDAKVQQMARDLLSFRLPRPPDWGLRAELRVDHDRNLIVLPTFPDTLRLGQNVPKHGLAELRAAGFDAFKAGIAKLHPGLAPVVEQHLTSWADTSFLEVFTAEVPQWTRDGLVLIGDASHTCTPILGQGVNIAIQDAVCLAPVVARSLAAGQDQAVAAAGLAGFVAERRRHKALVTRSQRLQETALAQRSPAAVLARRARYRIIGALPLKYRLFEKVLSAPHRIDPDDLGENGIAAQFPKVR